MATDKVQRLLWGFGYEVLSSTDVTVLYITTDGPSTAEHWIKSFLGSFKIAPDTYQVSAEVLDDDRSIVTLTDLTDDKLIGSLHYFLIGKK